MVDDALKLIQESRAGFIAATASLGGALGVVAHGFGSVAKETVKQERNIQNLSKQIRNKQSNFDKMLREFFSLSEKNTKVAMSKFKKLELTIDKTESDIISMKLDLKNKIKEYSNQVDKDNISLAKYTIGGAVVGGFAGNSLTH